MDSPDSHELRRLIFDTAHQYFASTPFQRHAFVHEVQRTGRALGWWLDEPGDHLRGHNRGAKASVAMIERAFSDLVRRGVLAQVKPDYWSFTASTLHDAK